MAWRRYRDCCQRNAADADVGFCPECGNPYMRCLAFAECGGLVTPSDPCPACVAPALMIDKGAVVEIKTGERQSVPLVLRNGSTAGRPVWIKKISKMFDAKEQTVDLSWEQIDAGGERRFTVDTPPIPVAGQHALQLHVVLVSRYKGIEECYAFTADIPLTVSAPETRQVVQNINLEGAQLGTGALVNTSLKGEGGSSWSGALTERRFLDFGRAEKYELEHDLRGYKNERLRVPRNVEFSFTGFSSHDAPQSGSTLGPRGRLSCGRNARAPDPNTQATPSDVCLRAYDGKTGGIDEPATLAISRHHFDVVVVNDRLCLQARATGGLEVNREAVAAGEVRPLRPGDRVIPIPGRPDKLALQVGFATSTGSVERVSLSRTPPTR